MENDQPNTPRPSRRDVLAATAGAAVSIGIGSALAAPGTAAAAAAPTAKRGAALTQGVRLLNEINEINLWQAPPVMHVSGLSSTEQSIQDELFIDKAVGHRWGTDRSQLIPLGSDLKVFETWPSVASTIYNKLLQMTGFDPSNVAYDSAVYAAFRNKFSTCPFWNGLEFNITYRDVKLYETNYRMAVQAVDDLINAGTTPEVRTRILASLKQCATLADSGSSSQVKQTLFENSTICITAGRLYVFVLYGYVQLSKRTARKYVVLDEDLRVVRGYGVLDLDFCKRHASSILAYDGKSVDDWEHGTASDPLPENPSPGWP